MNKLIKKKIKMKKLFSLLWLLCVCLTMYAQATKLTVDCQNPGWLSNKITYGDQMTVKDLTVTGYINDTDIKFLCALIRDRALSGGRLNLENTHIVGSISIHDDCMSNGWNCLNGDGHLASLFLPKSLKEIRSAIGNISVDSLYFSPQKIHAVSSESFYGGDNNKYLKHLFLGGNIDSIPKYSFIGCKNLTSIHLGKKMHYIGEAAFYASTNLKHLNWNEFTSSLDYIGPRAFLETQWKPDTILIGDKIENFDVSSFQYKDGCHTFLGKKVQQISEGSQRWSSGIHNIFLHSKSIVPLPISIGYDKLHYFTAYIPHGSLNAYKSDDHWGKMNLIEDITHVDSIRIFPTNIVLGHLGETASLSAKVYPEDASIKEVEWMSTKNDVCIITSKGTITATGYGECSVIAKSKDGGLQAICRVAVKERRPLTAITLDIHSLQLEKGEQRQLKAILTPENPDDSNVIWSRSNDNIEVSNTGIIKAKNEGKVWVYAKSTDGAIGDSCKVEVTTHVKGLRIEPTNLTFEKLGDSFKLRAVLDPANATDTTITWSCATTDVCNVREDGTVIAVGEGLAVILAYSNDGHYPATCIVKVDTSTGINIQTIDYPKETQIYNIEGKQLTKLQKGVNIVRIRKGQVRKVIIR